MPKPAFSIGKAPVRRVEELRIPNKISYFTTDTALIEANRHWLQPHFLDDEGNFDLVFQSFIIELEGRVVLVDPCTGNAKPHPVSFFDMLEIPWIERIAAVGYRPEDVDFVVCTHLHHDHCGWNTCLRDGKWVPTFPNARYVLQQAEVDRWGVNRDLHTRFAYNDLVYERSVAPVLEAGLADLVNGDHLLAPGLAVQLARGHTIGHQMLQVTSAGAEAYFTGDCFHHPIQLVEPTIPFGDAEDAPAVESMRRRLVQLAVDRNALLIAAHLPAPHALRAWREDGVVRLAAIQHQS